MARKLDQENRSSKPQISIVLPTFNRADLLGRAIRSVTQQDFSGWELIVVDDGSEDFTRDLVQRFQARCSRIRYCRTNRVGAAQARNLGVKLATASWVTFLDSDDAYRANHLRSRLHLVQQDRTLDLVQGGFTVFGTTEVVDYYNPSGTLEIYDCIAGATFFGRRSLFIETGGFKSRSFGSDREFWDRIQPNYRVLSIRRPTTYMVFKTKNSITERMRSRVGSPSQQDG